MLKLVLLPSACLQNTMSYSSLWQKLQYQFKQQCVRDLSFMLLCPNLLNTSFNNILNFDESNNDVVFTLITDKQWLQFFKAYLPKLQQLDQNPTPLLQFLAQFKTMRLGHYAEHLLHYWLLDEAFHPYTLVYHNYQLFTPQHTQDTTLIKYTAQTASKSEIKTIGEIDFVVFNCHSQQYEIWELCVKFYCGYPNFAANQWVGLNKKDNFAKKLAQISKQLNITQLENIKINKHVCIAKGQLFWPIQQLADLNQPKQLNQFINSHTPSWINPHHHFGFYTPYNAQLDLTGFTPLPRLNWLSPQTSVPTHDNCNNQTTGMYFNAQTHCTLVLSQGR